MDVMLALDDFGLDYIEQPLAWDDIHDHAVLQPRMKTAICLDECIRTVEHARKALASGATRVINIKVGRVGGYQEARRIHDLCAAWTFPVWCGGMLEFRHRARPQHPPLHPGQFPQARGYLELQPLFRQGHRQRSAGSHGWPDAGARGARASA